MSSSYAVTASHALNAGGGGAESLGDLSDCTTQGGTDNIGIGSGAGDSITSGGNNNICVGLNAGTAITTADSNIIIGAYAGSDTNYNASNSVLIGYGAGQNLQYAGATANVFVGYQAGNQNDDWQNNAYFGYRTGRRIEGGNNVAIGANALEGGQDNAGVFDSIAVGYQALNAVTSGDDNTAIGYQAGDTITTAANCVVIGHSADTTAGDNNQIAIGQGVSTDGANKIRLGNSSIANANIQVSWTVDSDERIKENIQDGVIGLDFINALSTKTFTKKTPSRMGYSYP